MNLHEYECMNMHALGGPVSLLRAKSVMVFLYHQSQQSYGPQKALRKFFKK